MAAVPTFVQDPTFRELITTFGLIKRVMEPYFARFGIGGAQWGVLRTLHRACEEDGIAALRLTELSDRLIIRPPSVVEVVNRLVRDRLVTRAEDASDQRAKPIKLTAAGRRLVLRVLRGHSRQIESVLGGLDQRQRQQLRVLLAQLRAHLDTLPSQTGAAPANGKARRSNRTAA